MELGSLVVRGSVVSPSGGLAWGDLRFYSDLIGTIIESHRIVLRACLTIVNLMIESSGSLATTPLLWDTEFIMLLQGVSLLFTRVLVLIIEIVELT